MQQKLKPELADDSHRRKAVEDPLIEKSKHVDAEVEQQLDQPVPQAREVKKTQSRQVEENLLQSPRESIASSSRNRKEETPEPPYVDWDYEQCQEMIEEGNLHEKQQAFY